MASYDEMMDRLHRELPDLRPIVRRMCPFCDWFIDDRGPQVAPGSWLDMSGIVRVMNAHQAKIEQVLESHLAEHVEEMTSAPPNPNLT